MNNNKYPFVQVPYESWSPSSQGKHIPFLFAIITKLTCVIRLSTLTATSLLRQNYHLRINASITQVTISRLMAAGSGGFYIC